MTATVDLDRLLDAVLREHGPNDAPHSLADRAIAASTGVSQPPLRIAWLDDRTWPPGSGVRVGERSGGLVAAVLLTLLLMLVIATGLAIGTRRPEPSPFAAVPPVPSLRPSIAVGPSSTSAAVSPSPLAGMSLLYGRKAGGLFLADMDGSNVHTLLADGWYPHPRLSPDRRWIATDGRGTGGRSFVILRPDGSVARTVASLNPIMTYAWGTAGPSAGWLAMAVDDSIVVIDPASGRRSTLRTGETYVRGLAWSPDAPVLWWAAVRQGSGDRYHGYSLADVHAMRVDERSGQLTMTEERSITLTLDPARKAREIEGIAVSPDGLTLALRVRIEGWLRSDLLLVDAADGAVTYANPAPPAAPWLTAWSGIRWLPDGSGVVAEVGDASEDAIVRPTVIPVDGGSLRPIRVGRLTVEDGGVVEGAGTVAASDPAILVGGARSYLDLTNDQLAAYDLWVADAQGRDPRLVARDTLGGDLR